MAKKKKTEDLNTEATFSTHGRGDAKTYECDECGAKVDTEAEIEAHISSFHPDGPAPAEEDPQAAATIPENIPPPTLPTSTPIPVVPVSAAVALGANVEADAAKAEAEAAAKAEAKAKKG